MKGKVYLVGAGPGDPELLTIKALRILKTADVVLHDELISPEILAFVPNTAFVYNVGKRCGKKSTPQPRINSLLINLASSGLQVVRLKGGDPFVFGRGGEEAAAVQGAGIELEVVPGITAALGAAASTQIPLTHRELSSAMVCLTSHHSKEKTPDDDWRPFVSAKATLVIYMPGYKYKAIYRKLRHAGLKNDTPCAIVSRATTPEQQLFRTTIEHLATAPQLPAPTLLIVGNVVTAANLGAFRGSPPALGQQEFSSLPAQFLSPTAEQPQEQLP
jgi:uroporphyrin-III C-methyltransferase